MKNIKKFLSVVMIVTMMTSLVACKSFKAIDDKAFEDAVDEVYGEEPREYTEDMFEYAGYDEYDLDCNYYYYLDDGILEYYEFDDEEGAREFFEDYYYNEFEDMIEDDDFEGSRSSGLSGSRGYIIVNGECDGSEFWAEIDEAYGGVYWVDNIVVVAMMNSDKKSDIKDMDAFLDAIGYPAP